MTKSELALLQRAYQNSYSDHWVCVNTGYRTHTKTKWGRRDFAALMKLRDKGLLERAAEPRSYTEQPYNAYGTDRYTEYVYKLTPKGLKYCQENF